MLDPVDRDRLVARFFSRDELHGAARHAEFPGEKVEQRVVGFSIHRRRLDFHFDRIAMSAHDLASLRVGHHAQAKRGAHDFGFTKTPTSGRLSYGVGDTKSLVYPSGVRISTCPASAPPYTSTEPSGARSGLLQ